MIVVSMATNWFASSDSAASLDSSMISEVVSNLSQ